MSCPNVLPISMRQDIAILANVLIEANEINTLVMIRTYRTLPDIRNFVLSTTQPDMQDTHL